MSEDTKNQEPKVLYETEYFRYFRAVPKEVEEQYLKNASPEMREYIFEQLMKIYHNTPKDQPFPAEVQGRIEQIMSPGFAIGLTFMVIGTLLLFAFVF